MTKRAKIIKYCLSALWWLAVILLAVLLINIIGAKARGEVPKVFGYSVMRIITGSMEDTIPTGTYILIRETAPEDVKEGDIISFYSEEHAIYGMPNTHRVKGIVETGDRLEFITRGDANPSNDTVNAKGERLIGVYVCSLDLLGDFTSFLNNGGMLWIMIILWVLCLFMIGFTVLKKLAVKDGTDDRDRSEDQHF